MRKTLIFLAAALCAAGLGLLIKRSIKRIPKESWDKRIRRKGKFGSVLVIFGIWLGLITLLPLIFGSAPQESFSVAITPPKMELLGLSISSTIVVTWIAMAVVLVGALLVRFLVIPKFKEVPHGIQTILELAVGGISSYTEERVGKLGDNLSAYLFSVAVLLVACAAVELFGVRAPTADITMTLALALITFVLINYYGIRKKGLGGRIKSLASPTAAVLPIRMVCDIAVPVSMACRLFGNMLGGLIVMDLLYNALGSAAVGIPSVVGLYFNVFHPLIQAFIFITLSLAFINEAVE